MEGYKFLHVKAPDCDLIPGTSPDAIGNLALVKLEIPDDATVVYPIDKEYYFDAEDIIPLPGVLPEEFISDHPDYVKAKKCRCDKAKVVEVIRYFSGERRPNNYFHDALYSMTCDSQPSDLIFKSMWNPNFIYKFNEYVEPDSLDEDICLECSNGIHFCRTIKDVIDYIETCGYTIMDKEETNA